MEKLEKSCFLCVCPSVSRRRRSSSREPVQLHAVMEVQATAFLLVGEDYRNYERPAGGQSRGERYQLVLAFSCVTGISLPHSLKSVHTPQQDSNGHRGAVSRFFPGGACEKLGCPRYRYSPFCTEHI